MALWGAWLQLGIVFSLVGHGVGLVGAFQDMAGEGTGIPEALANNMSIALITTAVGMISASVGLVLLAVALLGMKYRAPWFFCFLIFYGFVGALSFPVGAFLGGAIIVYLVMNKDEFLNDDNPNSEPCAEVNSANAP